MSLSTDPLSPAEPPPDLRDLEDHYGSYCRAMRMLVREGKSLKNVQRTVCWKQLALLHDCRPARYLEPDALYLQLCRERRAGAGGTR
ncbi:DUF3136 domain-containing protein [Synechococcus sp. CCY 9618]|uniref:DUF3136 domain-containing protein n=1 Tax=Synechococcus sp. CCY 9618 TaxID=2815602 RepID=UPI001C247D49|nr:DUF3136 domain-containing protein [Synechococcus sp. CCY 9618]